MSSDPFSGIKQLIQREMVKSAIPSFAVAVARNGEILWEEAFGWADREKRIPATEHTLYSQASISKPMTAVGLMKLVEQGKLDLDKPVNDYLHRDSQLRVWNGDPDELTVRKVANHTAGLPLHCHFFPDDEPYFKPPMEESIRRYGNVVTPPGEIYRYSNIGYGILDHLIERLSGLSYAEFMRREIFLPLGMTRSSVNVGPGLEEFQAIRYKADGLALPFYDFDHPGASAVYSSAHDLIRFGMFHLKHCRPDQKAVLSDESIDAMKAPTADIQPNGKYGIGWRIDEDELGQFVSHGGGMGGVATNLVLMPQEGIVIVALTNTFCQFPYKLHREILPVLLPERAAKSAERKTENENDKAAAPAQQFESVPELQGDWLGEIQTYKATLPLKLSFKPSGDVHARLGEQLKTLVNDVKFENGDLKGKMLGDIGTEDANRNPYHLHLDLKLRGNVLNGSITSISFASRLGNALSHWVEVRKE